MSSGVTSLVQYLAGDNERHKYQDSMRLRVGSIVSVSGSGTATITIGGDSQQIGGVPYLGGAPGAGKPVLVLQQGSQLVVLGTTANQATSFAPLTDVAYTNLANIFTLTNTFNAGLVTTGVANTTSPLIINTIGASGTGRTVFIKDASQATPTGFGSYPGAWTPALQIMSDDNSRGIWLSPLDTASGANANIRTIGTGLDVWVNSTLLSLTMTTAGITVFNGVTINAADSNGRVLSINATPGANRAHVGFGLSTATSGQPSAKLSFFGAGIDHAGIYWTPNTTIANETLTFSHGGGEDPSTNTTMAVLTAGGQFQLPIAGSGSGLLIGGDATLYRDGGNRLRTDSTLIVSGVAGFGASGVPAGGITVSVTSNSTAALWLADDSNTTTAGGGIALGQSRDTLLYRNATGTLYAERTLETAARFFASYNPDGFVGVASGVFPGFRMTTSGANSKWEVSYQDGGSGQYHPAMRFTHSTTAIFAMIQSLVAGEANMRWQVDDNGTIHWGAGGATALDTNLFRASAGELKTSGAFTVGNYLYLNHVGLSTDIVTYINLSGDSNYRLQLVTTGEMRWGSGSATWDTNLYRLSANILQTDDIMSAVTGYQAILGSNVVALALVGSASQTANYINVANNALTRAYLAITGESTSASAVVNWQQAWNTATTGLNVGNRFTYNAVPAGAISAASYNLAETLASTNQNWTGDIIGLIGQGTWISTGTSTSSLIYGLLGKMVSSSGSNGLVATAVGVGGYIQSDSAITDAAGLYANAEAGSGTFTNSYGVWVKPRAKGSTLSVGARIDIPAGAGTKVGLWLGADSTATDVSGGITFGSGRDVKLYRSAASTLTTDNIFQVGKVGSSGQINLYSSAASGTGAFGTIYMDGTNLGRIVINGGSGSAATENSFQIFASTFPGIDKTYELGDGNFRWQKLFVANNTPVTDSYVTAGGGSYGFVEVGIPNGVDSRAFFSLHRGGTTAWQLGISGSTFVIANGGGGGTTSLFGTQPFQLTTSGLGIGGISPSFNLDVLGSSGVMIRGTNGSATSNLYWSIDGSSSQHGRIELNNDASSGTSMRFSTLRSGTLTEAMRITDQGRVKQSINDSSYSSATGSHVIDNAGSQSTLYFTFAGVQKGMIRVDSSGNLIFNATSNNIYFNNDFGTTPVSLLVGSTNVLQMYTTPRVNVGGQLTIAPSIDQNLLQLTGNGTQTNTYVLIQNNGGTHAYLTMYGESATQSTINQWLTYQNSPSSSFALVAGNTFITYLTPVANASYEAWNSMVTQTNATVNWTGGVYGFLGQAYHPGTSTGTINLAVGVFGKVQSDTSAGNITQAYAVFAKTQNNATITTATGFYSEQEYGSTGAGTGAAITNSYGFLISARLKGSTLSVGGRIDVPTGAGTKMTLWLAGDVDPTTAPGGITFGTSRDTSLYRYVASGLAVDGTQGGQLLLVRGSSTQLQWGDRSSGQDWIGYVTSGIFRLFASVDKFAIDSSARTAIGTSAAVDTAKQLLITSSGAATEILAGVINGASNPAAGIDRNGSAYARNLNYKKKAVVAQSQYANNGVAQYDQHPTILSYGTQGQTVIAPYSLVTFTTSGTINDKAGWVAFGGNVCERDLEPDCSVVISTGATITSYRLWAGLTSADLSGVSAPTTQHVMAFRYDTGVDGTTWHAITCNGSSGVTNTDSTITVSASTVYRFRIVYDAANAAVRFFINDQLVATHSTNLPGAGTALLTEVNLNNLAASARAMGFSQMITYFG